jgi:hypothetical protein
MEMVESGKREDASEGYFVGVVCGDELNKLKFKYCSRSTETLTCLVYNVIVYSTENRTFRFRVLDLLMGASK